MSFIKGSNTYSYSPDQVGDIQCWLDAANYNASTGTWTCKYGNSATQSTPSRRPLLTSALINGLPAVTFDGVDDYLDTGAINAIPSPNNMTWFVVFKMTPSSVSTAHSVVNGYHGSSNNGWLTYATNVGISTPQVITSLSRSGAATANRGGELAYTSNPVLATQRRTSLLFDTYHNGGNYYSSGAITASTMGPLQYVRLGAQAGTLSLYGSVSIAEFILYSRTLSDWEIGIVQTYLNNKYAIY